MEERNCAISRIASAAAFVMMLALATSAAWAAPHSRLKQMLSDVVTAPPTDAYCLITTGFPCYSPQLMHAAYGLDGLLAAGMDGTGQTIVIVDSFGSPTIEADLHTFDAAYGLPDPPSFTILAPLGTVPYDPTVYPSQPGWAGETSLDVEWAHAMAPGASIVLLTSPIAETEGVQGLPEFLALETYALDHHLGQIISQSWTATENTLFESAAGPDGPAVVQNFTALYTRAKNDDVTVLTAAGDDGTSNPDQNNDFYPFPTVGFPASSPLVTAVGGTTLYASRDGDYQAEKVWSNSGCCAGGGGISELFDIPGYQTRSLPASVQMQLGGKRGIPDVAYNADCYNVIIVYISFPGTTPGFYGICGTSEGAPQWAGIVADLNQYAGHPLGFLNPMLYGAGGSNFKTFLHDIKSGNNALVGVPGAVAPGYSAGFGWDLATGWGSPNFGGLPSQPLVLLDD